MREIVVPVLLQDCVVSRGIEIQELAGVRKETILYVQPCASERGRLMADVELSKDSERFFDPEVLCQILEIHRRRFSELKCSRELGAAKFTLKGRDISVFRNGRLKIQRGLSKDDLMAVANSVARLVWAAAICSVCGKPAIFCSSGSCGTCASGEVSVGLEEIRGSELLGHGLELFERAGIGDDDATALLQRARYIVLQFIVEAGEKRDAAVGMKILADIGLPPLP